MNVQTAANTQTTPVTITISGAGAANSECGFSLLKPQPEPEIFTKLADVKCRINWTAERQKLLQEMWERGDKASAIAAALGCKVGAVNVARARFGLNPRRVVSGRPKQEPDEPPHKIERVAFTTSRPPSGSTTCKTALSLRRRVFILARYRDAPCGASLPA